MKTYFAVVALTISTIFLSVVGMTVAPTRAEAQEMVSPWDLAGNTIVLAWSGFAWLTMTAADAISQGFTSVTPEPEDTRPVRDWYVCKVTGGFYDSYATCARFCDERQCIYQGSGKNGPGW